MDLESRIKELPFFTKFYLGAVLSISACSTFHIISPQLLIFHYTFLAKFEVLLFFKQLFKALENDHLLFILWKFQFSNGLYFDNDVNNICILTIYRYFAVGNTEKIYLDQQKKYYSDFFYLVLYSMAISLFIGLFFDLYILGQCFVMSLLYIWCKKRPLEKVSFFFGIIVDSQNQQSTSFQNFIPGGYLPWVLVTWNVLTGNSVLNDLIGIGIGHLYIVLKDILPQSKQRLNLLETPSFLLIICFNYCFLGSKNFINKQFQINIVDPRQMQQQQQQGAFGGYRAFQGQGHRLQ